MRNWLWQRRLRLIASALLLVATVGISYTTFTVYDERRAEVKEAKAEADLAKVEAEIAKQNTQQICLYTKEDREILRRIIEVATRPRRADTPQRLAEREQLRAELLALAHPIECPPVEGLGDG